MTNKATEFIILHNGGGGQSPLLTDMVSYWSLDEPSGTRADSHGSNDLTDNNTVGSTAGVVDNAADFVAANSEFLNASDNDILAFRGNPFEVNTWVYIETGTGNGQLVVSKMSLFNATGAEYVLILDEGNLRFRLLYGDGSDLNTIQLSFASGIKDSWNNVSFGYDGANVFLLLNAGTPVTAATATTLSVDEPFRIGRGFNSYLDVPIDETAYWSRALTADERTFLYNSGSGRSYADILAYTGA